MDRTPDQSVALAGKENTVAPNGQLVKGAKAAGNPGGLFFVSASPPLSSPAPPARLILKKFQKPVLLDFKVRLHAKYLEISSLMLTVGS